MRFYRINLCILIFIIKFRQIFFRICFGFLFISQFPLLIFLFGTRSIFPFPLIFLPYQYFFGPFHSFFWPFQFFLVQFFQLTLHFLQILFRTLQLLFCFAIFLLINQRQLILFLISNFLIKFRFVGFSLSKFCFLLGILVIRIQFAVITVVFTLIISRFIVIFLILFFLACCLIFLIIILFAL